MESNMIPNKNPRRKKRKDLLSLKSINDVLTKIIDRRNTWVARDIDKECIYHMKYTENVLRYMFCDVLSEDLRQISNKQAISDLFGHDLELHYLNKTVRSQIDSIVRQHQTDIVSAQSSHIQKVILLSVDLFYVCLDAGIYLFTDENDKYNGSADELITISKLKKHGINIPDNHKDDTKHLKAILCKELYEAFVKPIRNDTRYQWLYELVNNATYIKFEQCQISEDFLYDFIAIISILALDLSDSDNSTEPYMNAVCSFLNVEMAGISTNPNGIGVPYSINDGAGDSHKKTDNMIATKIKENQELEELKSQLDDILKRLREMIAWYDQFRYDSDEIAREIDKARSCIASLKEHFDECYEAGSVIGMRQEIKNINSVINKSSSLLHSLSTQLTQNRSN